MLLEFNGHCCRIGSGDTVNPDNIVSLNTTDVNVSPKTFGNVRKPAIILNMTNKDTIIFAYETKTQRDIAYTRLKDAMGGVRLIQPR